MLGHVKVKPIASAVLLLLATQGRARAFHTNGTGAFDECPPKSFPSCPDMCITMEGSYSVQLDGQDWPSLGNQPHKISSMDVHTITVKGTKPLATYSKIMLAITGVDESIIINNTDTALNTIRLNMGSCGECNPKKCTSITYYVFSDEIQQTNWKLMIPFQATGLELKIVVVTNASDLLYYDSVFRFDVGGPSSSSSSWHTKMWEILLGLGTIGVAVKFVVLNRRERAPNYEQIQSEYNNNADDDDDFLFARGGQSILGPPQVEFVPLE